MQTAQGSRRNRQAIARRASLVAAAAGLFSKQGYDETTIDEIADAADLSRGTFFNYFPTKLSVLEAHYARLSEEFVALMESTTAKSTRARLSLLFKGAEKILRREGRLFPILYREVFINSSLTRMDASIEKRVFDRYVGYIEEGQRAGEIRRHVDAGLAARLIIDIWAATLRGWVESGQRRSLSRELDAKMSVLLAGLASRKRK